MPEIPLKKATRKGRSPEAENKIVMRETLGKIVTDIDRCLSKDRHNLKRKIRRITNEITLGKNVSRSMGELEEKIKRSIEHVSHRQDSIPNIRFPDLPVVSKKQAILRALSEHQVTIVCGETGSGKTTQLPKLCLSAGRGTTGFIGHTQPRRIAARSVASRIAEELGEPVGRLVGYKIRFHDTTKPQALVKVMTDGILLAETQSDGYLNRYDTLIIDEAHERSLNIDFLLGYLKWLLPKRPELKVMITSATIDTEKFSQHFHGAPVIEVSGRSYPVEIRYRDPGSQGESDIDLQQAIVEAVVELSTKRLGDILVFLSGEREIREVAEALRKHHPGNCEILPLFSRLSGSEQARIFQPHKTLRIILSTNVAETSLTVPGIHCVIDAGQVRMSRYSARSKLQRLPIESISKASANQRAGRCGRLGPGICVRLYSEEEFESRPDYTDPEITRTHLASVILTMKALKLGDVEDFPFIDPPESRLIRDGVKLLQELNALDDGGQLTKLGRRLSRFPFDPRLGRMLLAAENENCLSEIAIIVSGLSIQDPRERPIDHAQSADQCHAQFQVENSDFLGLLNLWTYYQEKKQHLSNNKLRQLCRQQFLSYRRLLEWQDIYQQIIQLIKGEMGMRPNLVPAKYDEVHRSLLSGLLSNIGFRQETAEYSGARNQKFFIHPSSNQFGSKPRWIVASERVETTKVYARNVAKVDPSWIEQAGGHLVKRDHYEPHWEKKPARAAIYERVTLYGLTLVSGRKIPYERIDPSAAREMFIRSALVNQDYRTSAIFFQQNQALLESMNYLHHKGRRIDLLADEDRIYRFYDERIPEWVVSGVTFDRWRKQIEKDQPDALKLTAEILKPSNDGELDEKDYPDELVVGNDKVALSYRFEPGHDDDGVTAIVPLHQLNRIEAEPFEWIVPGLLREKTITLMKALPKQVRRNFVPVPDYADRFLNRPGRHKTSLYQSLAEYLTELSGIQIHKSIWETSDLDNHLKIKYRLIDEDGSEIDRGCDLSALKQEYAAKARASFSRLSRTEAHSTSGYREWEFGELPERVELGNNDQLIVGYPAIVDEGESVGVQHFDTAAEARTQHKCGLIRIIRITLSHSIKYLRKYIKVKPKIELIYNQLSPHPFLYKDKTAGALHEDLISAAISSVFIDNREEIRSKEAFESRIRDHKADLLQAVDSIHESLVDILICYRKITEQLEDMPNDALAEDIREQLSLMLYSGFLRNMVNTNLRDISRYLKAILYRIDKARENRQRDLLKLEELRPFWKNYWESIRTDPDIRAVSPESDHFRWSLEEYRVSLFAQVIKTAFPVSAKRLEKAWQASTSMRK